MSIPTISTCLKKRREIRIETVCRLSLCALLASLVLSRASAAEDLPDISRKYQENYEKITTLRMDYRAQIQPLMSEEYLFREHEFILWGDEETSVISHRDGRIRYREVRPVNARAEPVFDQLRREFPKSDLGRRQLPREVPFDRFKAVLDKVVVPPKPTLYVFDGKRLFRHKEEFRLEAEDGSLRQSFVVMDTDRLSTNFVPITMLDYLLFAFEMPGLKSEAAHRLKNRLPDIWTTAEFVVASRPEPVDGVDCLMIDAPGKQRLYLDPALGYAVRKRQWSRADIVIFEVSAGDFSELLPGVWLPRRVTLTDYASRQDADGKDAGKPRWQYNVTVDVLEANRPEHLKAFSIDIPAGSFVINETLRGQDSQGQPVPQPSTIQAIPSVTYVQPANADEIERVVQQAQRDTGKRMLSESRKGAPTQKQTGRFTSVLVWFNVGILIICTGAAVYRRSRKPSQRSP